MPAKNENEVVNKLDQILRILALQVAANQESVTEGVRLLKLAGLDNKTIASVLNTSEATVRAIFSNLNKTK